MVKINQAELDWTAISEDSQLERKKLGAAAGSEEIGCSLYRLPAGSRSWPYHYHTGNEEALFVLDGTGLLRLDGDELSLTAGDYVALPADKRSAHRVVSDSPGELRYLMVSTMNEPDVTVYPDSGKIGVFAGAPPGGEGERTLDGYYRTADAVGYWDGERDGETSE